MRPEDARIEIRKHIDPHAAAFNEFKVGDVLDQLDG